jgi:trans-feruloyl-CoA hydratase/vanillin synthase
MPRGFHSVGDDEQDIVKYEIKNNIAWVYYNRPDKRNSHSPALNRRMYEVIDELEYRDDFGVLVLTGEGSAFSAGMDLQKYFREAEALGVKGSRQAQREAFAWWDRLRWYQKPTIAMVNGWCFGGAYAPLYACDLAFCSDDAQFGLSEINWGILPGGGATKVATNLMSERNAMFHTLLGENLSGPEAAAQGLVNESLPSDKLEARVIEIAEKLMEKNPITIKAAKDAVKRVTELTFDNSLNYLIQAQMASNFFDGGKGRQEGMKQFLDDKTYRPGLGAYDRSKEKPE